MSAASDLEWYMLELINAERTSRGLSELQMELNLNESAEAHSEWMISIDAFSHTGSGGSNAGQRMDSAGFDFSGGWGWGENIAYQSLRGDSGVFDDVADLHENLMNSPGHRANILNPDFEAIGIGIEVGEYNGFTIAMATQNFAYTGGNLDLDNGGSNSSPPVVAFTPLSLTAAPDGPSVGDDSLSLNSAGRIEAMNGDDEVTGSSGNDTILGGWGDDTINGGNGADEINGGAHNDLINGEGGNDVIFAKNDNDTVYGGSGQDEIHLGWGNDAARGGNDADMIRGSLGNDLILGDGGNDKLYGDKGNDSLEGGTGNDMIRGGAGSDILVGGTGNDSLYGGADADTFVFIGGNDLVFGFQENLSGERIDLSSVAQITSFNDLMSNHIRDVGKHVEIFDGVGNTMIVRGVNVVDLDTSDFLF